MVHPMSSVIFFTTFIFCSSLISLILKIKYDVSLDLRSFFIKSISSVDFIEEIRIDFLDSINSFMQ